MDDRTREALKRIIDAANNTVQQSRKEFSRGELDDIDSLEDAVAEAAAILNSVEN